MVWVLLSNDNSRLKNRSNSVKFNELLPGFPLKTAELTDSIVLNAFSMSDCLVVSKVLFQTLRRSGARKYGPFWTMSSHSDEFLKLINQQFQYAEGKVADYPAGYRPRPEPGKPMRKLLELLDLTVPWILKSENFAMWNQVEIVH